MCSATEIVDYRILTFFDWVKSFDIAEIRAYPQWQFFSLLRQLCQFSDASQSFHYADFILSTTMIVLHIGTYGVRILLKDASIDLHISL